MNSPPANESRCTSRAASVNSRAARCSGAIFEVSMSCCGSSGSWVVFIKSFSGFRHAGEQGTGLKVWPALFNELRELLSDSGTAEAVRIAQRPAAERRPARPHYHREVYILRMLDDLFLKAASGFVDHGKHHPVLQAPSIVRIGFLP